MAKPIQHVFTKPVFAPARTLLLQSATGRELVSQLEQVPTRTIVFGRRKALKAPPGAQPKLFGVYAPMANLMSVNALTLRDDTATALTLAHEGVHRLRRRHMAAGLVLGPIRAMPDAARGAIEAARSGGNPFKVAARVIDRRSLNEEYLAFSTEGKIALELGLPPGASLGPNGGGILRTEDELIDRLLEISGYRSTAWLGRANTVLVPTVVGGSAVGAIVAIR